MFFEQILMYIHKSMLMYFFACFFLPFLVGISVAPPFFCIYMSQSGKKRLRRGWDHNYSGGLSCRQVRWGRLGHDVFVFKRFWAQGFFVIRKDHDDIWWLSCGSHVSCRRHEGSSFLQFRYICIYSEVKALFDFGSLLPMNSSIIPKSSLAVTPKVILLTLVKPCKW